MIESKLEGWRERSKGRRKCLRMADTFWSGVAAVAAAHRRAAAAGGEQPTTWLVSDRDQLPPSRLLEEMTRGSISLFSSDLAIPQVDNFQSS
jgi:hypothetical protein